MITKNDELSFNILHDVNGAITCPGIPVIIPYVFTLVSSVTFVTPNQHTYHRE